MRKLAIGGLAVAGVVAAAATSARTTTNSEAATPAPAIASDKSRIAVLPIEQLTADTLLNVVANGLQTDLIDELAQFPALTVISKNGVLQFRGNNASTDSIARVLNVGSVITSSVRRVGDSVRVTVRLVDGATGVLRSTAVDSGSVHDLLAVRSSIIRSVTNFLRTVIGIEVVENERLTAQSSEAWELNARVRSQMMDENGSWWLSPAPQRIARFNAADSMLMRAAKLDQRWPVPLVSSAFLHLQRANFEEQLPESSRSSAGRSSFPQVLRLSALARANDALSRAANHPEALYMRGKAFMDLWRASRPSAPDSLRIAAETDLRAATKRRPDLAAAWNDLSQLLQMSGAYAGARDAANNALKADAFLRNAPAVMSRQLVSSLEALDTATARALCVRGRRTYPNAPYFWGCELTLAGWTSAAPSEVAMAWRMLQAAEARDTQNLLVSGWATRRLLVAAIAARAGMRDSAAAIINLARGGSASQVSPDNADYGEAYVRLLLGEPQRAMPLVASYLKNNPAYLGQVRASTWFEKLHANPEFTALTTPH